MNEHGREREREKSDRLDGQSNLQRKRKRMDGGGWYTHGDGAQQRQTVNHGDVNYVIIS